MIKRLPHLVQLGILDKVKNKYVLSEALFAQISHGSNQDADRQNVRQHIDSCGAHGTTVGELMQLISKEREQVRWILTELKRDGLAESRGHGRGARWYATK